MSNNITLSKEDITLTIDMKDPDGLGAVVLKASELLIQRTAEQNRAWYWGRVIIPIGVAALTTILIAIVMKAGWVVYLAPTLALVACAYTLNRMVHRHAHSAGETGALMESVKEALDNYKVGFLLNRFHQYREETGLPIGPSMFMNMLLRADIDRDMAGKASHLLGSFIWPEADHNGFKMAMLEGEETKAYAEKHGVDDLASKTHDIILSCNSAFNADLLALSSAREAISAQYPDKYWIKLLIDGPIPAPDGKDLSEYKELHDKFRAISISLN